MCFVELVRHLIISCGRRSSLRSHLQLEPRVRFVQAVLVNAE